MRLAYIGFGLVAAQMTQMSEAAVNLGNTFRAMQFANQSDNTKQNRVSQKKRRLKARRMGKK